MTTDERPTQDQEPSDSPTFDEFIATRNIGLSTHLEEKLMSTIPILVMTMAFSDEQKCHQWTEVFKHRKNQLGLTEHEALQSILKDSKASEDAKLTNFDRKAINIIFESKDAKKKGFAVLYCTTIFSLMAVHSHVLEKDLL
jgi:hypothetical protein